MSNKIFFLLLLTYSIFHTTSSIAEGTVRYVSKTGSSTPPYTSWETAADSIQKCINISQFGDTIYVANGVYAEKVIVDRFVYLIGSSQDSTIIDGSNEPSEEVVRFNHDGVLENFTIKARGQFEPTDCVRIFYANAFIKNCKVVNGRNGFGINASSSIIENCISIYSLRGISAMQTDTAKGIYRNNVIISKNSSSTAILHIIGGSPTMIGNLVLGEGTARFGVGCEYIKSVIFKNNLISGYSEENMSGMFTADTTHIINNTSINTEVGFAFGPRTIFKNNLIKNTELGVSATSPLQADYNLFWDVTTPVGNSANLGEGNIFADPMFVNDTIPTLNGTYDFHLQKYSPAIDAGDPNILDVDGSRSDIGMYGGPDGERYEYLDLAPRTPKNFTHSFDTTNNTLTLNWDMNTEYDFRNYNIYRDTISGFTPGENNLVAQTDTSYFPDNLSNVKSQSIYYRVTAVDSQDNESQPGNQIAVTITGVEPGVQILRDYILYQNYPNPFNPTTRIGYEIKERAYVKLMVYDIKGELVSVLVNKEQTAGYYEVEFNAEVGGRQSATGGAVGNGLASGIYLYRIEVIGEGRIPVYSDMKKMLMIK